MLDGAVRLGLATVEQTAALVVGARPVDVTAAQLHQAERAAAALESAGLVEITDLQTNRDPLPRRGGREQYRIGRSMDRAERLDLGIYPGMALDAVGRAGSSGLDGVALRQVLMILVPAELERMLDDLVRRGLLVRTVSAPDDLHRLLRVTRKGYRSWARRRRAVSSAPLVPPKQPGFGRRMHHVLTVEAVLECTVAHRGRFVAFRGDGDIRGQRLAGRPIPRRGPLSWAAMAVGPIPDAEITFLDKRGNLQTFPVEVLSSGYTEDMIRAKLSVPKTIIFTSTPTVVARAKRVGPGRRVTLLDGSPLAPAPVP
ncbi:MAG: hypothetical protein AMXMBFR53_09600 [Gemmatimonadota bacterium]